MGLFVMVTVTVLVDSGNATFSLLLCFQRITEPLNALDCGRVTVIVTPIMLRCNGR
jgi:hypothetical protein